MEIPKRKFVAGSPSIECIMIAEIQYVEPPIVSITPDGRLTTTIEGPDLIPGVIVSFFTNDRSDGRSAVRWVSIFTNFDWYVELDGDTMKPKREPATILLPLKPIISKLTTSDMSRIMAAAQKRGFKTPLGDQNE
jgi:hypothetical protein